MDIGSQILSEIVVFKKYAKYIKELNRRETWDELITRNVMMHIKKYPDLAEEICKNYQLVYEKKVLPSMRALKDDTPIITKNGWKTVGDVVVGDIVYDSQGNETTILEVFHHQNKQLYEIKFSDHSSLTCCGEHLWVIKTNDDLASNKARIVDTVFIKNHLKQSDRNNIHIQNPKPIKRKNIDLELDPYILGHWLGDGYSSGYQYSSHVDDSSFFKEQYKKCGFVCNQSKSSNVWTWYANGLGTKLRKLNLIQNKHIPEKYLRSSFEQRLFLVQGLMDSDGCIMEDGRCLFSNTNPSIVDGMKELLSSFGIKYTSRKIAKTKDNHKDGECISFFTTLNVSRLPRKLKNIKKENNNDRTDYRIVFSVNEVEKGNATCFKVSSSDHTFLAGKNMIVTHNCMQFAGRPIELLPTRSYNCSYLPIDDYFAFAEVMFLLLGGSGVGFSVQKHHVEKLPPIRKPINRKRRFLIPDSIEGWADSIKILMKAYFFGTSNPVFDFSGIRAKGEPIVTAGGVAPGPDPLRICLESIRSILDTKEINSQLTTLEVHDIMCFIADAVLTGGIRRAAMISFFSFNDEAMISAKYGNWFEINPQRARANNSAVILRHKIKKKEFMAFWQKIQDSHSGEPGIFFTNNSDVLSNPCGEVSLKPFQFCVAGDTKLITKHGIETIQDVVGDEIEIWNGSNWSKVSPFITGDKDKLYRVSFSDGSYLDATANHKFLVKNRFEKTFREVETIDLIEELKTSKYGLQIPRSNIKYSDFGTNERYAFEYGFFIGDGHMDHGIPKANLYNEDKNIGLRGKLLEKEYFNWNGTQYKTIKFDVLDADICSSLKSFNGLPYFVFSWNRQSILDFMAGWIDADGTQANKGCRLYGK